MPARAWFGLTDGNARRIVSLAVCTTFVFGIASCDKSNGTPDWDHSGGESPTIEETSSKAPAAKPLPESPVARATPASGQPLESSAGLRFIA